jgi:hypothetical protein
MYILLLGIIATAFMDLWAFFMKVSFSIQGLDYRLLGRWIGHMPKGRFFHQNIFESEPVSYEVTLGYIAHYGIGVMFAAVLCFWQGKSWRVDPSLTPALIIGLVTIVAPFFIMQPAFGFGVAALKIKPTYIVWFKSFMAHASYGVGLFIGGYILSLLESHFNL